MRKEGIGYLDIQGKSERNQGIAGQHKAERKQGLQFGQPIDPDLRLAIQAERRERLKRVVLYSRDALPVHSKGLIEEPVNCA